MKMTNILIIGASGLVGSYIFNYFSKKDTYKVYGTYYRNRTDSLFYLDKSNKKNIQKFLEEFNPDIVIDSSYQTDVDRCEVDKDSANLNVDGTKNVVEICEGKEIFLIFFSSDYVFNGKEGPYTENDEPNPISIYGKQKLQSEKIMCKQLKKFLIIRVATVYGFKNGSKNTLQKLKDAEKSANRIVKYVNDQWTTPTWVEDIPKGIEILLKNECTGIWHISSGQFLNRFDFAHRLVNKYKINIKVEPISTYEVKDTATRPKKGGLKIDKIKSLEFTPRTL